MRALIPFRVCSPIAILALFTGFTASACAKSDTPATDTTKAAAQQAPPAPAPLSLSALAGTWNGTSQPTAGPDTTTTHYVLKGTADTTGWTITYPKGKPIPVHIKTDADSMILDAGPYTSVRMKGVKVTVHSVTRLQDGKMVGTVIAHYRMPKGDSSLTLRTEATRAP